MTTKLAMALLGLTLIFGCKKQQHIYELPDHLLADYADWMVEIGMASKPDETSTNDHLTAVVSSFMLSESEYNAFSNWLKGNKEKSRDGLTDSERELLEYELFKHQLRKEINDAEILAQRQLGYEADPDMTVKLDFSDSVNWKTLVYHGKSFFYVADKAGIEWLRLESTNANRGFFYPSESWLEVYREPVVSGPTNGVWTITFKD